MTWYGLHDPETGELRGIGTEAMFDGGEMLCRKVADHGTKAAPDSWEFTVEVTVTAA